MKKLLILALTLTSSCLGYFREDATLLVPSEYPSLQAALNELDEKPISREVTVTIQIADGTYNLGEPVIINHPNASQIQIVGNQTDPSLCKLVFNSSNGIEISDSTSLALIDGIEIEGNGTYGVLVNRSSSLTLGENVVVKNFNHGVFVANSSNADCAGVSVQNASSVGITSSSGSHVKATSAIVSNCGIGISANMNSSVHCDSATISSCTTASHAANGSFAHALSLSLSSNTTDYSPSANSVGNWQSYIRTL